MRRKMRRALVCSTLALAVAGVLHAQDGQTRSFDVASVRLTAPNTRASHRITNTRVDLINITLRQLLWMAFRIDPLCCRDRLTVADWTGGVSFDVQATIPADATREDVPEMMKALLVQRFGLRSHTEPRVRDGFELVVGSGGLRMQEVEPANELEKVFPADPSGRAPLSDRTESMANGPMRVISLPVPGNRMITERSIFEQRYTGRRTQQIDAARISMPDFVWLLVMATGQPVIDGTQLTGVYTFNIELPMEAFAQTSAINAAATGRSLEPSGVSAVKAVEQLGLRLEPRRIPLDTIVVDHVDRAPTVN